MSDTTLIAGVPFESLAREWAKAGPSPKKPSFTKWLREVYSFPESALNPSTRILFGRKIAFFQDGPFGDQEIYRGRLVAYGKGLVVFEDALESPSLDGVVERSESTDADSPFMVRPFLRAHNPEFAGSVFFGAWKPNTLLRPREVLMHRYLGTAGQTASSTAIYADHWNRTNEWLDHWLPK